MSKVRDNYEKITNEAKSFNLKEFSKYVDKRIFFLISRVERFRVYDGEVSHDCYKCKPLSR